MKLRIDSSNLEKHSAYLYNEDSNRVMISKFCEKISFYNIHGFRKYLSDLENNVVGY